MKTEKDKDVAHTKPLAKIINTLWWLMVFAGGAIIIFELLLGQ